jgi:cyclic pyranopterin phosphate synthase
MRDISQKVSTLRTAVAKAIIRVSPSTIEQIRNNTLPKGNPLDVARVAAVQAAKNTSFDHSLLPSTASRFCRY